MNPTLELALILLGVLICLGCVVYYGVVVLPEITYYNSQLKVCNCSAVCSGKAGYALPGNTGSDIVLKPI